MARVAAGLDCGGARSGWRGVGVEPGAVARPTTGSRHPLVRGDDARVARGHARRREEMRAEWCKHHQGQAVRLRAVLEELIADHEEQAEKYLPKGA